MSDRAQMGPTPHIPVFLIISVVCGLVIAESVPRLGLATAVATGVAGMALSLVTIYAVTNGIAWAYKEVSPDGDD